MKNNLRLALLIGAGLLALPLVALPKLAQEAEMASARATASKLDKISWLSGHWRLEVGEQMLEELWTPARGGMMIGLNRSVSTEGATFEYLRIEERADGIFYVASPQGAPGTDFKMVEASEIQVAFENPENDFPKRIEYSRTGDALTARISGADDNGHSWTWIRVSDIN